MSLATPPRQIRSDEGSSRSPKVDATIDISDHVPSERVLAMSSPKKLLAKELAAHRPSPMAVAKVARWAVGVQNRSSASDMRQEKEQLRLASRQAAEKHRAYGASLRNAGKLQLAAGKAKYESVRQLNHDKGDAVRDEADSSRIEAERARQEWAEHGRTLVLAQKEERARTRDAVSPRVSELHIRSAREKQEHAASLHRVRESLKECKSAEAERVRTETAASVATNSRILFYQQRRALVTSKSTEALTWREERAREEESHLARARANRAAIEETKRRTKEQRARVEAERRATSLAAKTEHQRLKAETARAVSQIKDNAHDFVYRQRYASQEVADEVFNSSLRRILP